MRRFLITRLNQCPETRFVCGRVEIGECCAPSHGAAVEALYGLLAEGPGHVYDLTERDWSVGPVPILRLVQRDGSFYRRADADQCEVDFALFFQSQGDE